MKPDLTATTDTLLTINLQHVQDHSINKNLLKDLLTLLSYLNSQRITGQLLCHVLPYNEDALIFHLNLLNKYQFINPIKKNTSLTAQNFEIHALTLQFLKTKYLLLGQDTQEDACLAKLRYALLQYLEEIIPLKLIPFETSIDLQYLKSFKSMLWQLFQRSKEIDPRNCTQFLLYLILIASREKDTFQVKQLFNEGILLKSNYSSLFAVAKDLAVYYLSSANYSVAFESLHEITLFAVEKFFPNSTTPKIEIENAAIFLQQQAFNHFLHVPTPSMDGYLTCLILMAKANYLLSNVWDNADADAVPQHYKVYADWKKLANVKSLLADRECHAFNYYLIGLLRSFYAQLMPFSNELRIQEFNTVIEILNKAIEAFVKANPSNSLMIALCHYELGMSYYQKAECEMESEHFKSLLSADEQLSLLKKECLHLAGSKLYADEEKKLIVGNLNLLQATRDQTAKMHKSFLPQFSLFSTPTPLNVTCIAVPKEQFLLK
ncbi:MAG: hypothetical protein H0W64_10200 [Gammaproteobacteria bacterium]|nr:hypothetical protein [Gammaproteobacteria bacterium]